MQGRKPFAYKLQDADEHYLQTMVRKGQLPQRVANRARVLLALDRGERIVTIVHWLGVGRMTVWELGSAMSGAGARPSGTLSAADDRWFFPPLQQVQVERAACTEPAAYGLHLTRWDCRTLAQVVVEQAVP